MRRVDRLDVEHHHRGNREPPVRYYEIQLVGIELAVPGRRRPPKNARIRIERVLRIRILHLPRRQHRHPVDRRAVGERVAVGIARLDLNLEEFLLPCERCVRLGQRESVRRDPVHLRRMDRLDVEHHHRGDREPPVRHYEIQLIGIELAVPDRRRPPEDPRRRVEGVLRVRVLHLPRRRHRHRVDRRTVG